MIKVEKKIALDENNLKVIERLGAFLGSRMITDTYFDTSSFHYTTSDIWLRERECRFELKIGIPSIKGEINRYEEISSEETILKKLGLEKEKNLNEALQTAKIHPFATFQTIHRKYQIEKFMIDLNLAYYDDFIYRLAEVEITVDSEDEVTEAKASIDSFVKRLGLDLQRPIKAKLLEYLCKKNPTHYEALLRSGTIPLDA